MKQFIRCDHCDKVIPFGSNIFKMFGRCGCYCSGDCFAAEYAECIELDKEEAENSCATVYGLTPEIAKTIADLAMKELDLCSYDRDMLENDINNLRGYEWQEQFEALPENSIVKTLYFDYVVEDEDDE